MKNKVLHIVLEASYNGATVYATRLSTYLNEYNQEMVSCFNGNAVNEIRSKTKCVILLNTKQVSYKYLHLKYWKFFRFIRNKSFDVIHYHQGGVGILLLAYFFRKHAVVVHHLHSGNLIGDNTKDDIPLIHRSILKYLSNKTYQIAVAEHIIKEYVEIIGPTKNLKLIRNSTPFLFEQKSAKSKSIGFIGRFTKEKGFYSLSNISFKLKEKLPEIKILAMGNESELFKEQFGKTYSNIRLINPELSTENFYRNIDLLLFLSTAKEGMPLVVLEAVSYDVGVIAYPLTALKEILGEDYPLFVNNETEAADIISSYYENKPNMNNISLIHQNICNKYNEEAMLNSIRELYSKIQIETNL